MAYLPESVLELANRQFGIVTTKELLELERDEEPITRAMVNGWLARGYLEQVQRGVHRLAGTAGVPGQCHYAALRRAGSGARMGGVSALWFFAAEGFTLDDAPFVVLPPGRRLVGVSFHWVTAPVPNGDAAVLPGNVPGVTPTRALIEAAGVVQRRRVRVGYDDLRRRDMVQRSRFVERAHALLGIVPGAETALDIAASGELDKESEGERALATAFVPSDPWPLWQVWVLGDVRVDALFPEARLALEYHGRRFHSIEEDRRRDRARAARLAREAQIEVIEVWDDDLADRAALRRRILDRRAERVRDGVEPLRDFRLDRR